MMSQMIHRMKCIFNVPAVYQNQWPSKQVKVRLDFDVPRSRASSEFRDMMIIVIERALMCLIRISGA